MYPEEEIKKLAWNNEPTKDNFNLAELLYFSALRGLAIEYKAGRIGKETLKRDAQIAHQKYRVMLGQVNMLTSSEMFWKRIEGAAIAFMKNKTIETAMRFYEAVYNLGRQDAN
ncbi:MAG: hypothetical protein Q4A41_04535 [Bacillota bacterium]|nr:hypothetical protein [Bacillota bacterium]